ncbi:MAG: translesion error-prone DNA polymerase V autoproteolytic subunit [Pseudomonadota bacterium]
MAWGGKRINAGRPKGTGKYGEPTKPMRIPISKIDKVLAILINENDPMPLNKNQETQIFKAVANSKQQIPLYSSRVAAGLPAPATCEVEDTIDLNEHLLTNPTATYFVRATGESMIGAGIYPGDLLVVDCHMPAQSGRIVIALIDGELTVKRLFKDQGNNLFLMPENPDFEAIQINEEMDFMIWGVVTNTIHKV